MNTDDKKRRVKARAKKKRRRKAGQRAVKLQISADSDGDCATFHLKGSIDEHADFSPILGATAATVVLDFDGAQSVNSFGVKAWLDVVSKLRERSKVQYINCPVAVVEQMNVVMSLCRHVDILSFYLPMVCDSCDVEYDKKVTTSEARASGFMESLAERYTCEQCERHLEFADDEDMFFQYLEHTNS